MRWVKKRYEPLANLVQVLVQSCLITAVTQELKGVCPGFPRLGSLHTG
jgi:hypothetical protein